MLVGSHPRVVISIRVVKVIHYCSRNSIVVARRESLHPHKVWFGSRPLKYHHLNLFLVKSWIVFSILFVKLYFGRTIVLGRGQWRAPVKISLKKIHWLHLFSACKLKRPTFQSVCGLATELNVLIAFNDRMSKMEENVFYKDDEDRFRQRWGFYQQNRNYKFHREYFFRFRLWPSFVSSIHTIYPFCVAELAGEWWRLTLC